MGRRRPHGHRAPYGAYVRVGPPPPDREDADRREGEGTRRRRRASAPAGGGTKEAEVPPRTERTLRPLHEKAEKQGEVPGEGGRSRR